MTLDNKNQTVSKGREKGKQMVYSICLLKKCVETGNYECDGRSAAFFLSEKRETELIETWIESIE